MRITDARASSAHWPEFATRPRVTPRHHFVAVGSLAAVLLVACTGSGEEARSDKRGVLQSADLVGEGWTELEGGGFGTACTSLAEGIRVMSGVSDGAEVTYMRDGVFIASQAWVERRDSATRARDFDRMRSRANWCEPLGDDPGHFGVTQFDIVEDETGRFVVYEKHVVRGENGGADQIYFQEGPVIGRIVVIYDGTAAPFAITELEEAARSRAAELAETAA